ncbi:MAG TPA: CHAP domain-containing protein [Burkholderiaceae bacterium]|nr:CHAP domain-containing protein [Burkholderiaceae bacterium]
MRYPGRVIRAGEADARIVKALKTALNRALALRGGAALVLDADNPRFGPRMTQAVRLFQARHLDDQGQPLKIDGEVGALTWAALFGAARVPAADTATDPLLAAVLAQAGAAADAGVREQPKNSNRGPEVDEYLRRAGVPPGLAWCCAFTYWCFDEAARAAGRPNPMVRTAGCLAHWNGAERAGARRIAAREAIDDPGLLRPGMVFIMDFGGGLGHTGFVETVEGGFLHTIEGNTDASQSREGGGVYRLTRKVNSIGKGFIDYAGV